VEIQSGHQLKRALGADMVVMPGIGHLPYEEAPQEFNRVVLDYLRANSSLRN
jgi:pimeloyl-ACP methyl ester carboxylesterase